MKIAYLSNGMWSQLHMSFALSGQLREAGHEVVYLSQADRESAVRAEGYRFIRLVADQDFARQADQHRLSWSKARSPRRFTRTARERWRLRRRSIANDEIERQLEQLAPDRLVVDLEMHFAILATARLGIPTWLAMCFFSVHKRAGLPPLHTTLRPAASGEKRWRLELAWWRLRLETRHYEWRQRLAKLRRCELFETVTYDTFDIQDLRAVARNRRFPLRRECSRWDWLRPYMYHRLPVLCFNIREMDLPQEKPSNIYYVGGMVHLKRADSALDPRSKARWQDFQKLRHDQPGQRPLIYCSLGSFWSADHRFLSMVIDVFTKRQEWDLVLGLGGRLDAQEFEPVPSNIAVLDWAPQIEILEQCDCAITHGGVSSLNECIRLGVPMVVYSTGFVEQNGNATRVDFHGVGIVADKERDGAPDLEQHVARALRDTDLRQRVQTMRDHYCAYERSGLALQLLETAEVATS